MCVCVCVWCWQIELKNHYLCQNNRIRCFRSAASESGETKIGLDKIKRNGVQNCISTNPRMIHVSCKTSFVEFIQSEYRKMMLFCKNCWFAFIWKSPQTVRTIEVPNWASDWRVLMLAVKHVADSHSILSRH